MYSEKAEDVGMVWTVRLQGDIFQAFFKIKIRETEGNRKKLVISLLKRKTENQSHFFIVTKLTFLCSITVIYTTIHLVFIINSQSKFVKYSEYRFPLMKKFHYFLQLNSNFFIDP